MSKRYGAIASTEEEKAARCTYVQRQVSSNTPGAGVSCSDQTAFVSQDLEAAAVQVEEPSLFTTPHGLPPEGRQ
jgi:hypothetical protein